MILEVEGKVVAGGDMLRELDRYAPLEISLFGFFDESALCSLLWVDRDLMRRTRIYCENVLLRFGERPSLIRELALRSLVRSATRHRCDETSNELVGAISIEEQRQSMVSQYRALGVPLGVKVWYDVRSQCSRLWVKREVFRRNGTVSFTLQSHPSMKFMACAIKQVGPRFTISLVSPTSATNLYRASISPLAGMLFRANQRNWLLYLVNEQGTIGEQAPMKIIYESSNKRFHVTTHQESLFSSLENSETKREFSTGKRNVAKNLARTESLCHLYNQHQDIVLELGTLNRKWFSLDFTKPLSPIQAFAISLSFLFDLYID